MKPNLYICHTAYQVLVDLLRASRTDGQPHTMVLSAAVPDGRFICIVMGEQDGLFYTLELCVSGKDAEQDIALFEEKFVPGVAFAYQQIDTLGSHDEETSN